MYLSFSTHRPFTWPLYPYGPGIFWWLSYGHLVWVGISIQIFHPYFLLEIIYVKKTIDPNQHFWKPKCAMLSVCRSASIGTNILLLGGGHQGSTEYLDTSLLKGFHFFETMARWSSPSNATRLFFWGNGISTVSPILRTLFEMCHVGFSCLAHTNCIPN